MTDISSIIIPTSTTATTNTTTTTITPLSPIPTTIIKTMTPIIEDNQQDNVMIDIVPEEKVIQNTINVNNKNIHHQNININNNHNNSSHYNNLNNISRPTSPSSVISSSSSNHGISMHTVINNHGSTLNIHSRKTTPTKINSNRMSMAINNSEIDILFNSLKNSITSKNSFILGVHRHRSISNTTTLTSLNSDASPSNIITSDINSDTLGRASAITITNSDINSSDSNAGALNQPSFNELTITCDTLTETDEEEDLVESFLEDDEEDDINNEYNQQQHQQQQQQQQQQQEMDYYYDDEENDDDMIARRNQKYLNQKQQQEQQQQQSNGNEMINEKEFMKFQRQFLHHTNSSSSFIRTPNQQPPQQGSSLNLANKSAIGGSLLDRYNNSNNTTNNNSNNTNTTPPFINSPTEDTATCTDSSSINEGNSSFKSTQNSVIYKPSLISLSSLSSSSLISATNSTKCSPYLASPMVSPRLASSSNFYSLSHNNNNSNNNNIEQSITTDNNSNVNNNSNNNNNNNNSSNMETLSTPTSNNNGGVATTSSNGSKIFGNSGLNNSSSASTAAASSTTGNTTIPPPTPITAGSSTSSTSLLSSSSSSSFSTSSSNNSSPKPSKKSKSVFSKIIKEGTKRLVTKLTSDNKKDSSSLSDPEELPSSFIIVYRSNGDESWKVKINKNTTAKELLIMLSQPPFLKLYLSSSLNACNCSNNQQQSNCNINNQDSKDSKDSNKCNNCNQPKLIEKELSEDDKILYVQKKWISSGTTSSPPLYVLKSNLNFNTTPNINNNNNNSNLTTLTTLTATSNSTLYNNNSISKNTQHYLLNNNNNSYSGRYSVCSLTSESSDYSNSSHTSQSQQQQQNSIQQQQQQQQNSTEHSPTNSPWSSPNLTSPKSTSNPLLYNPNLQHIIPSLTLDNRNSIIYTPNNNSNNNNSPSSYSQSSSFLSLHSNNDQWKKSEKPRSGIRWINSSDVNLLKNIGSGSFSKVYKAKYMGEIVAVKILNGDITPEQIENFKKEYDVLSLISSPHLIKFYGACKENKLKMVVEYCQHGSLYNMMSHKRRFEIAWPLAFKWMRQAVEGINVLHTMTPALVHRDIKSQNLLINSQFDLKVADFGLAKPTELQTNSSTLKGTMAYCAPELYSQINYTEKSDVYSLGIVLWELTTRCLTGRYHRPYEDHTGISFDFQIVIMTSKQGIRPTMPEGVPLKLSQLITKCWHQEPSERPNCEQVLLSIQSLYDDYISDPNYWNGLIFNPNSNNNNNNNNNINNIN